MLCQQQDIETSRKAESLAKKHLKLAVIGGSNSVMRDGYTKYFQEYITKKSDRQIELSYFALGSVTSLFGAIQNHRYSISKTHDVILFEYCVNDRSALINGKYTLRMAGMTLEGFIRQARSMNPNCIIIILIFGTNIPKYYNNCCYISAVYESIAKRYDIPVINVTEILLASKGKNYLKNLYEKEDPSHYHRPEGTKIIGETIAEQILKRQLLDTQSKSLEKITRVYSGNLEGLKFFSNFDAQLDRPNIEKSLFENRLFREKIYTLKGSASIDLLLKGRLLGIMLKSDYYDGLIKIKLGSQELITSTYSKWIKQKNKSNINLLSLPYKYFDKCKNFTTLSIAPFQENLDEYELDQCKGKPKVEPSQWKVSIVGIAYTGEIKIVNYQ